MIEFFSKEKIKQWNYILSSFIKKKNDSGEAAIYQGIILSTKNRLGRESDRSSVFMKLIDQ